MLKSFPTYFFLLHVLLDRTSKSKKPLLTWKRWTWVSLKPMIINQNWTLNPLKPLQISSRTLKNPELQIYKLGSTQQQQVLFNYNIVVVGNLFEIHSTTKRSGEFQEFMKASDVQAICFQACCCYHAIN